MTRVVHVDSGETAIARKAPSGCVLVQFNRFDHPQSHGWHLYPRHHFKRRCDTHRRVTVHTRRPPLVRLPLIVDDVPNHAAACAVPGWL